MTDGNMQKVTCTTCRYLAGAVRDTGFCYRYPPVETKQGAVTPFIWNANEHWCGEWKAKDLTQG